MRNPPGDSHCLPLTGFGSLVAVIRTHHYCEVGKVSSFLKLRGRGRRRLGEGEATNVQWEGKAATGKGVRGGNNCTGEGGRVGDVK